jgi:hypothetical protein
MPVPMVILVWTFFAAVWSITIALLLRVGLDLRKPLSPLEAAWRNVVAIRRILDSPGPPVTDPACTDPAKIAALRTLPSQVAAMHRALDAWAAGYGQVPGVTVTVHRETETPYERLIAKVSA